MTDLERLAMTIFEQYLDLPAEDQPEFLRSSCGDNVELRREVDMLISSDREANRLSEAVRAEIAEVAEAVRVSQSGSSMAMFGAVLNDRYVMESRIGSGGVGVVFRARDQRLHDRKVVVKVLREAKRNDPWLLNKFLQESEALTRIDHPNVVKVLDLGTLADGRPFLVMEFVKGESLEEFLRFGVEGLEVETIISMIRQICGAVDAVHAAGIIHRDLKTNNLMVDFNPDGTMMVRLIDFGIAKIFEATSGTQTTTPLTVGTLPYMAAELFDGGEASVASDVYALGIIVFELLTGTRPFAARGSSLVAQILEYRNLQEKGAGGKLSSLRPDLTDRFEKTLLKALSYHPEDRYRNVREFETALVSALGNTGREGAPVFDGVTLGGEPTIRTRPDLKKDPVPLGRSVPTRPETDRTRSAAGTGRVLPAIVLGVIGLGIVLSITGFPPKFLTKTSSSATPPPSKAPETPRPQPVEVTERPFVLTGVPDRVKDGQEFHLNIDVKKPGYLYLLSQSPKPRADTMPDYTVLFPGPGDNDGAARFEVSRLLVPPVNRPGFVFTGAKGTERLWCVWSSESIPVLEAARTAANLRQEGAVRNPELIQAIRRILSEEPGRVVQEIKIERP